MTKETSAKAPRKRKEPEEVPASNRRAASRHDPGMRAAVWFSIGAEEGELCILRDISLTGFGTVCSKEQLAIFAKCDHPLYCVLLLGVAHFGCMVRPVDPGRSKSLNLGFSFDAIPEEHIRLVKGLIARMAARDAELANAA
jgi:hypothetical protein